MLHRQSLPKRLLRSSTRLRISMPAWTTRRHPLQRHGPLQRLPRLCWARPRGSRGQPPLPLQCDRPLSRRTPLLCLLSLSLSFRPGPRPLAWRRRSYLLVPQQQPRPRPRCPRRPCIRRRSRVSGASRGALATLKTSTRGLSSLACIPTNRPHTRRPLPRHPRRRQSKRAACPNVTGPASHDLSQGPWETRWPPFSCRPRAPECHAVRALPPHRTRSRAMALRVRVRPCSASPGTYAAHPRPRC